MNKKARRKALAMVLSDKVSNENLIGLDALNLSEGKTKELQSALEKLPLTGKKTLIVTVPENKMVARAAQNIENVNTVPANALNVVDLLRNQNVIMTEAAVEMVSKIYNRA
jgi:large subunit ribosomal protein L4